MKQLEENMITVYDTLEYIPAFFRRPGSSVTVSKLMDLTGDFMKYASIVYEER
jgi:hypothetical protein